MGNLAEKTVLDTIKAVLDTYTALLFSTRTKVLPTLANGITVTGGAGVWALGTSVDIVAANAITTDFWIDAIEITSASGAGQFEVVLTYGAGLVEFARFRTHQPGRITFAASLRIPANSKIGCQIASLAGAAQTLTMSTSYHQV